MKTRTDSKIPQLLKKESKFQCGQIVDDTSCYVTCRTCNLGAGFMYCVDCFLCGDHEGHDWQIVARTNGVCDCGDVFAVRQGCSRHSMLSPDQYWKQVLHKYSDQELERFALIVGGRASNVLFQRLVNSLQCRMLAEMFFICKYGKFDVRVVRNLGGVVRQLQSEPLRGYLADLLSSEAVQGILARSMLAKIFFYSAVGRNFDLVRATPLCFLGSLEACQLTNCAIGARYMQRGDGAVFAQILAFVSAQFESRAARKKYDQLFHSSAAISGAYRDFVFCDAGFLKELVRLHTRISRHSITPFEEYDNYKAYQQQLISQDENMLTFFARYYDMYEAIDTAKHTLDEYVGLLCQIYQFCAAEGKFAQPENAFNLYPFYMLQQYILQIGKVFDISYAKIFGLMKQRIVGLDNLEFLKSLTQQYFHIMWFIKTVYWRLYPKNQDDNEIIMQQLLQLTTFSNYYKTMSQFCNFCLSTANLDIVELVFQCLPSKCSAANNLVVLSFMLQFIFSNEDVSNQEYYLIQLFAVSENFTQSILFLSGILMYNQQNKYYPVLQKYCTQIKNEYRSQQYQLSNFDQVNIFNLMYGQTQVIINYSIMKGSTQLLPCISDFGKYLNQAHLKVVSQHGNISQLLLDMLSVHEERYDLYFYFCVGLLNRLLLNTSAQIVEAIQQCYSDDHLKLFFAKEIDLNRKFSSIPLKQRLQKLRGQQRTSDLCIADIKLSSTSRAAPQEQEICCCCHQPLSAQDTVCLYDVYPAELNVIDVRIITTCRHLFHQACVNSRLFCPICNSENSFYLYHVESPEQHQNQHLADRRLHFYLTQSKIALSGQVQQISKLFDILSRAELRQTEEAKLGQFLRMQLYIVRQLVSQRIAASDLGLLRLEEEGTLRQYMCKSEKQKPLAALPESSEAILRILTKRSCCFCGETLGLTAECGQCLACGLRFHNSCYLIVGACKQCRKPAYYLSYSGMTILHSRAQLVLTAPYKTRCGMLAQTLFGERLTLDQDLLSVITFNLLTGRIYVEYQNNSIIQAFEELDEQEEESQQIQ